MNRKQRRTATEKDMQQEDLSDKIALFQNLPNECLACIKPFYKKDKEMVFTWSVVVRDADTVRLYCPECWDTAQAVVKQFEEEKEK